MALWANVHTKVKAAFLTSVAAAVLAVAGSVTDSYSGAWVSVVAALAPVVAGWLKSAGDSEGV